MSSIDSLHRFEMKRNFGPMVALAVLSLPLVALLCNYTTQIIVASSFFDKQTNCEVAARAAGLVVSMVCGGSVTP